MKYYYVLHRAIPFLIIGLLFSCAQRKDVVYYQDIDAMSPQSESSSYEIKIQQDDLLSIIVSAEDPEIAVPFNLSSVVTQQTTDLKIAGGQMTMQLYLVDANGNIEFPIIGKLKVSGLTRTEVMQVLHAKIATYIKNPIINLRITNFKVSIQGEVTAPGSYPVNSERITLMEALALAGDLTIYGKRNNILIIRETNGVKSFNRVDITNAAFLNSPFYYLAQNDVVYVEPNKSRINAAAVGPNTGVIISISSLLITLITLIVSSSN